IQSFLPHYRNASVRNHESANISFMAIDCHLYPSKNKQHADAIVCKSFIDIPQFPPQTIKARPQ
ncbi:hypothetical protein, partial [Acinetobacter pittii]|uniref:hypothetical protein n=1 Tax=Acinetobacter pittii TaxID=48296 RepID=UPI003330ACDA